jgi:RNA polymerase sigma factor (sigma-70 family)
MNQLPEEYRILLDLKFLAGLKLRQIEEIIGSSKGTLSRKINEALDQLRELLQCEDA